MPTFDVVSEVDPHELSNAVDQAHREISNRFDFKGTAASVSLKETRVLMEADSDFQVQQMHPVLYAKLIGRGIEIESLEPGPVEKSGKGVKQTLDIRQGIDRETAKKATTAIKQSKLKVQAQVQGEQLRVTGKKRDDLQAAMKLLKEAELGLPLQFKNFRD